MKKHTSTLLTRLSRLLAGCNGNTSSPSYSHQDVPSDVEVSAKPSEKPNSAKPSTGKQTSPSKESASKGSASVSIEDPS